MKAMLLCAGYGTRLGDLTRDTPKPMLRLGGRPLLEYSIRNLVRHGFDEIVINLHFRPELIRDYFDDGRALGARLSYAPEEVLLGTAGSVRKVAPRLGGEEPFLVQYGDILSDEDLGAVVEAHRESRALATILVHHRPGSNSVVVLDDHRRVARFLERPTDEQRRAVDSPWVFSGMMIAQPELLKLIPDRTPCDLPRDVFPRIVGTGRLFGFPISGYRCAIDSPSRLAEARDAVANGRLSLELPLDPPEPHPARLAGQDRWSPCALLGCPTDGQGDDEQV